jgi:hypothetical protein
LLFMQEDSTTDKLSAGLSSASSAFSFVDICRHSSDLLCLRTIELWDMSAGQCRSALMTTAGDDSYGTRELVSFA